MVKYVSGEQKNRNKYSKFGCEESRVCVEKDGREERREISSFFSLVCFLMGTTCI